MTSKRLPIRRFVVEFGVIVVGVLVALAFDRGVQGLEEETLERTYLEALLEEFQAGADEAAFAAGFIGERMDLLRLVDDVTETGTAPDSLSAIQLARAVELAGWHPGVTFRRVTWEDLLNTGRLALISNPELRRQIARFYIDLDLVRGYDAQWQARVERYVAEVARVLTPDVRVVIAEQVFGQAPLQYDGLLTVEELTRDMRARPEFRAGLGDALLVAELSVGSIRGLESEAREVIAVIEAELER